LYGGNPIYQQHQAPINFPNFVFEKHLALPKLVGDKHEFDTEVLKDEYEELDRCLLALASFKENNGAVGYDGIRLFPKDLTLGLVGASSYHYRNEYVPMGHYTINAEDIAALVEHAKLFKNIHSTLEIACQRLVDAGQRAKPRDSIMDAVIGLESILLTDAGDPKYRGELRNRFSMNFSTIVPNGRLDAFRLARDLYDLRSAIAHGGSIERQVKIGGKDMTIIEASNLAKETLRKTIQSFKDHPDKPRYLAENYWLSLHMR
jgi:hypothetical protein